MSGFVFTARDAVHKRIIECIDKKNALPFEINNAIIYYAGATPEPPHLAIGSCGPTTSGRMDVYTPTLLDMGLAGMIGKGVRNGEVISAIKRNRAVYLCAIGGAGALACRCVKSCEEIAFPDLGCESVKKLEIVDFPLIAAIDCSGGNLFRPAILKKSY